MATIILLGIDEIDEIEEPFGTDPNDLPWMWFANNNATRNVEELIANAPQLFPVKYLSSLKPTGIICRLHEWSRNSAWREIQKFFNT